MESWATTLERLHIGFPSKVLAKAYFQSCLPRMKFGPSIPAHRLTEYCWVDFADMSWYRKLSSTQSCDSKSWCIMKWSFWCVSGTTKLWSQHDLFSGHSQTWNRVTYLCWRCSLQNLNFDIWSLVSLLSLPEEFWETIKNMLLLFSHQILNPSFSLKIINAFVRIKSAYHSNLRII